MYTGSNVRSFGTDGSKIHASSGSYDISAASFLRNPTAASIYQSTPKTKVSPSSILNSIPYQTQTMRISSPPKTAVSFGPTNVIGNPGSQGHVRSPSPSRSPLNNWSPTKFSDVEMSTIQKQRKELQLLIGELKDRDRELNELVTSHQKQIIAWETDRQRVLVLERQNTKLKAELKKRIDQVKHLRERVKAAESEGNSKSKELEDTQLHLQQVSEQANISTQQVQELQERNENLTGSVQELSSSLGQLQAREQELETALKLKESDIKEANIRIAEVTQKLKKLQSLLQESKKNENALRLERDQYREQFLGNKTELERLRADVNKQASDSGEHQAELSQAKQETLVLQKELFLAGEREKRKDQLLELSKSKQERTETELQHLRQLYERQQRDLMFLQQQIHAQDGSDIFDRYSEITTDDDSSVAPLPKMNATNNNMYLYSDLEPHRMEPEKTMDINELETPDEYIDMPDAFTSTIGGKSGPAFSHFTRNEGFKTDFGKSLTNNLEADVSPTSRLHKLLEESRKMVQTLEDATPLSSTQTTPEQKKELMDAKKSPGKDSERSLSPNVTLGSIAMNLNGYCSDSSN